MIVDILFETCKECGEERFFFQTQYILGDGPYCADSRDCAPELVKTADRMVRHHG